MNKIEERKTARDWDPRTHESPVMVDSGASVNVCHKWLGNSKLEQSDGATCLRSANGKPLQENGKRQIWLKICGQTKRCDFHVVDVTKPILSVSCLCENGVEAHLANESFLRFGDGHEPLIRKGGVYFVKAPTVNTCVRADGCTEKTREYNQMDSHKIDAYKRMDSQKTREYQMTGAQKKTHAYKLMDSQKTREYEMTGAQKKIDAYKLMDSRKTREYEMTGAQKKIDAYKLMDSRKIDEYEMIGAQKMDEYEMTTAQKIDEYEMTGAQRVDEYEVISAWKKTDEYELMD